MQRVNAKPFPIFPAKANARSATPNCSNGNAITEEKTLHRVHLINGDISANIPEESEYIGENMDCISKVIILSE